MGIGQLSDTELILVVLSLFYLSECICWLPAGAVCLVTSWRRCRFRGAAGFLQNERGGFVCGSPLPTGRTFLCPPPWLDALRALERAAANPPAAATSGAPADGGGDAAENARDGKPAAAGSAAAVSTDEQVEPVEQVESVATASGKLASAPLPSGGEADRFTRLLNHVTDIAAARARVKQYEQAISLTGSLSLGLFLIVFVGGPLLYYTAEQPILLRLAVFLGAGWLYWLLTGLSFFRAHRKLYPAARSERRRRLLMLMFSPAVAMRSRDLLARPLLAGYHPLTAAAALCRPEELSRFAREELLKLKFPLAEEQPVPAVARGELSQEECRERLVQRLEECLAAEGIDPGQLLAAPEQDPDGRSYCPRCSRQSVEPAGHCPDCVEIELLPFPPAADPSAQDDAPVGITANDAEAEARAEAGRANELATPTVTGEASVAGEGSSAG
ncbi:MAG: hypothetical protein KDA79_14680 [Planctomycetaceae bacterium]|nr:hypothetical protein [Planctomycetaceae bacterium]